jgi:cytochrome c oxidase subunit II
MSGPEPRLPTLQSALDVASPEAAHIRDLWWLFFWISTAVFVLVLAATLLALFRRRPMLPPAAPPLADAGDEAVIARNVGVAAGATLLILLGLLIASVRTGHALAATPADPLKIRIVGQRWWWQIEYVDPIPSRSLTTANELHVPVGRDVLLELTSRDVIHSLWVPGLQGKRDLIPGRVTTLRFKAERAGVFRGQCAEFCGLQHAHMGLVVVAEDAEGFGAWLEHSRSNASEPSDATEDRGRRVFLSATCPMCHTIEGTAARARVGPDLTHIAGRSTLAAATLPNEREQLRDWIRDPQRFKPGTPMPAQSLPDEDLDALLAYLGSLR